MAQADQASELKAIDVIDSDGHIFERDEALYPYLDQKKYPIEGLRRYYLFRELDGLRRGTWRQMGGADDVPGWHKFMNETGISKAVLFPTMGLAFAWDRDFAWCADLARAYNNFMYDEYLEKSPRLKAVALLPVQDPAEAARELHRTVTELGMVGGVLPTPGLNRPYGDSAFDVLYKEAQSLDVALGVHGASLRGLGFDSFESYKALHILGHPFGQMIQFTSMVTEGVFERFPRLRVVFLEAGGGWVPYLMERIDNGADRRGIPSASEQVRNHPIYFHAELEEREGLVTALSVVGDDRFCYASDYPHEPQEEIKEGLESFLAREDVSLSSKQKILSTNVKEAFGIK